MLERIERFNSVDKCEVENVIYLRSFSLIMHLTDWSKKNILSDAHVMIIIKNPDIVS